MPVSLEQIRVKHLGPLREIDLAPGALTVIYGRNEQGKTSLVEFLLQSLFRSGKGWGLRDLKGTGRVLVNGLEEGTTEFSPDSQLKLDDFWEDRGCGYPPDLARLLVVKGAELDMAQDAAGGVNRAVVRQYLSRTAVLEDIQEGIQSTVREAVVRDGVIEGSSRGRLKDRQALQGELEAVDALLAAVNADYSSGRLAGLQRAQQELDDQLSRMERARRHQAFQLNHRRQEIQKEIERYPGEELDAIQRLLNDLDRLGRDEKRKTEQATARKAAAADYEWLSHALDALQELPPAGKSPSAWVLILAVLTLLCGAVLAYMQEVVASAGASVVGLALAGWYAFGWRKWQEQQPGSERRSDLEKAFRQRFQENESDEGAMRVKQEELHEEAVRFKALQEEVDDLDREMRELKAQIRTAFRSLGSAGLPEREWEQVAQRLAETRAVFLAEEQEIRLELASLGVRNEDFLAEDVGEVYDPERLRVLTGEYAALQDEIRAEEAVFSEYVVRIRQITGQDAGASWTELLHGLQVAREEKAAAYRSMTASILGENLTAAVIASMLAEEDDQIRQRLTSPLVQEPLFAITGRYQRVDLEEDELKVSDAYETFPLAALSTGAQEQVLLALRMGFAAQLLGEERLFLLLDDAFQYADWERRERLVERVIALVKDGWQVLYFTMDDHLRELFKRRGKKALGDGFVSCSLPVDSK